MTILTGPEYEEMLHHAVGSLFDYYGNEIAAARVQAAIDRARRHVRAEYAALTIAAPPPQEFVDLVIGLARQELDEINAGAERRSRPVDVP